jgi:flagellar hook-associated protein 2
MSGAASISGLASGLDTATIIDQLMLLEAVPQSRLQKRVSSEQLVVNAMQTLNSKLASLATKATDLGKAATWSAVEATSSNDQVAITTSSTAQPTSFSLRVDQTALAHRLEHASSVDLDATGTVPATVRLDRLDGTTLDLTTDGTLQGLVDAVNDPANDTGLRATAVKVGTDQYRLLVESTDTGAASDFTLTDAADGSALLGGTTVRTGRDAQVTLGDSIVATSATNTFADLVPGVTVTLAAGATGSSDVTLTRDPAKLATSVQGLVDGVNAALGDIDSLTAYNPTTKASGLLSGDAGVRSLRTQLLGTVFPADGTSLADLGVQTDRSGKLVFDKAAFTDAYAADPSGVQQRLAAAGTGFAARVEQVATRASDKVDGTLTTAITGRNDGIRRLTTSIEDWDQRLELRRTALTRQFTALETALSRMNSQASWLAGQISSLPTMNTGS